MLRLAPQGSWVTEYFPMESVIELGDGGVEVTLRIVSRDWLIRLLTRLGGAVTFVEPADLEDEAREHARRALRNY